MMFRRLGPSSLVLLSSCATLYPASIEGLEQPDSLTVYALAPEAAPTADELGERIQGIPVRRRVAVTDRDARHHIVSELTRAMNEEAEPATCWKPHYAIRAREGRRSYEMLLSFECHSMSVAGEGKDRPISQRAQLVIMAALAEN